MNRDATYQELAETTVEEGHTEDDVGLHPTRERARGNAARHGERDGALPHVATYNCHIMCAEVDLGDHIVSIQTDLQCTLWGQGEGGRGTHEREDEGGRCESGETFWDGVRRWGWECDARTEGEGRTRGGTGRGGAWRGGTETRRKRVGNA